MNCTYAMSSTHAAQVKVRRSRYKIVFNEFTKGRIPTHQLALYKLPYCIRLLRVLVQSGTSSQTGRRERGRGSGRGRGRGGELEGEREGEWEGKGEGGGGGQAAATTRNQDES